MPRFWQRLWVVTPRSLRSGCGATTSGIPRYKIPDTQAIRSTSAYSLSVDQEVVHHADFPSGQKLRRGFCEFVLDPIFKLLKASVANKRPQVDKMLANLNIQLKGEEKELQGKDLMKCVMPKFLPLGKTLLQMMVVHLPSPAVAQKYRVENLYTGSMSDECATAIANWCVFNSRTKE